MWLSHSNNHIFSNIRRLSFDKSKIKITRIENTNKYVLYWSDLRLWGTSFDGKEFVLYSKLKLGDELPDYLTDYFLDNPSFEVKDNKVLCRTIGRYIASSGKKKCILDVVFSNSDYAGTEYLSGTVGVCPGWKYDIDDSSMKEFVMEKIEEISIHNRTLIHIIRHLMCCFSSENSSTSLINGRWDGNYSDGRDPIEWTHTSEIFREWLIHKKPIRYGQCWVFSECMTCAMRFLNIPSRTIYAENSHINPSLTCNIDFFEEEPLTKSETRTTSRGLYRKIPNMDNFLSFQDKSEPWEKCSFYDCDDSIWNVHYWNEIYIPNDNDKFSWECIDITPSVVSLEEPKSGYKILGPCKVNSLVTGYNRSFDFSYLNSSINSPFRIWTKETVVSEGEAITVPFVKTLIFPFYKHESIGPGACRSSLFLSKKVKVMTEVDGFFRSNITDRYKMSFSVLDSYLNEGIPANFRILDDILEMTQNNIDDDFYVQQVSLDIYGSIISLKRQTCKLSNVELISYCSKAKFLSFLITRGKEFWTKLLVI